MGFSKQSGTKPYFFEGQKELAAQGVQDIGARLFGGSPSYTAEALQRRGEEAVIQSAASGGFAASDPVTQARLASVDAARVSTEEQMWLQLINQLMSPAGQSGGGGWGFDVGQAAGMIFSKGNG